MLGDLLHIVKKNIIAQCYGCQQRSREYCVLSRHHIASMHTDAKVFFLYCVTINKGEDVGTEIHFVEKNFVFYIENATSRYFFQVYYKGMNLKA